jgi:ferredoxin
MKRKIIRIDEEKCTGCEECIPNCPEGAIQIIDGKARLISDLFCDGLGACIGECPVGAISVEQREAQPYDERRVMENVIPQGQGVIRAHLSHLRAHGEHEYLAQALALLGERGIQADLPQEESPVAAVPSRLRHWPVQLHLIPPSAPYFRDADVLLAADCAAYAHGDFHGQFLRGRGLAIACPKLDSNQDIYLDKLKALIDFAGIRSLTVLTMEVPCCRGLLQLARRAAAESERQIPVRWIEIGVQGDVLQDQAVG